jgi:hypothetical protein
VPIYGTQVKWWMTSSIFGDEWGALVYEWPLKKNPTVVSLKHQNITHRQSWGLTKMSLLSSPTLPNLYVLPSHRSSSKATAETKEEWPWHRATTLCSHGEMSVRRSSCPPVCTSISGAYGLGTREGEGALNIRSPGYSDRLATRLRTLVRRNRIRSSPPVYTDSVNETQYKT